MSNDQTCQNTKSIIDFGLPLKKVKCRLCRKGKDYLNMYATENDAMGERHRETKVCRHPARVGNCTCTPECKPGALKMSYVICSIQVYGIHPKGKYEEQNSTYKLICQVSIAFIHSTR